MGQINKVFASKIYEEAKKMDISPLYITAMTCLESGWGKRSLLSYNLFGERANSDWKGKKKLLRVTEIHHSKPILRDGESIVSHTQLTGTASKYIILRWFKDYQSIMECLEDHVKVFDEFPNAMEYRKDPHIFPKLLCSEPFTDANGELRYKKYDSSPNYPEFVEIMYKTLLKLGIKD